MKKTYLHADLDAFFASVEILDHPQWKDKPVIVGGKPEDRRSVVSTASYEARKYGVHSAMPTAVAYRLCPNGIFVYPRMERYLYFSEKVMSIFARYSPDVQQISIDEAFIDLTGTEKLFGPAKNVALKIKQEIKAETGLTVSIGLAATKYLAKIASDMKKPDGFFEIPEGTEESFMLSLPLKKIWGIGEKTANSLLQSGLRTTKDIHEKSLALLTALFGNATGTFLFNAVRGQEKESFNTPAKTHSISAENTYPYDLTSKEAIETALLELSHTVIWRMRKENLRSYTVNVKIRYENFVTVSAQETSLHEISSIDDLFERSKKIFYKKADSSKGIRLLGIALQNTESATNPRQSELFDFGEEKKRKVEEAVLKTESKIPGIKITKARLLTPQKTNALFIAFFSALFFSFAAQKTHALTSTETSRSADGAGSIVFNSNALPPQETDTTALFNYSIFDKEVEFTAEGYWKSLLTGSFSSTFGFGNQAALSAGTPVLSSEVDLSLFFLLNKKWYFEAAFADHFDKNTVAAGYKGEGILKEARIANRGIKFPSIYSVDCFNRGIGGGENLAPGLSAHLEENTWQADFALRYEAVESKSKTWYGKNSVSVQQIALEDYETGFQYILPSKEAVLSVSAVYVESSTGSYKDKKGRTYKKLNSSQYVLSAQNYSVFLSKDAKAYKSSNVLPAVALEFDSSYSPQTELGSYGTASSPGSGFLGKTQEGFTKDLKDFSLELTGTLNNSEVYYIQYPSRFSPYAACYRYDAGILSSGEASVCSSSTSMASQKYSVTLGENDFSSVLTDFFNTSHIYADVYTQDNSSVLDVKYRFPFSLSEDEQGAYLGYGAFSDLAVSIKTYSKVSRFEIGTNAVEGSVRVYKNGIQDSSASYDSSTGCITLSASVSSSDKIVANWYEDSSDSSAGALALAAGIKKEFSKNVSADFSLASRWTIPKDEKYSASANSSPGYATLAGGFYYKGKNFNLTNTSSVSLETTDTTGKYIVSKMSEEKTQTFYLSKTSGQTVSSDLEPVINPRPAQTSAQTIQLEQTKNGSLGEQTAKTDSSITGYAIPVSWDFSSFSASASSTSPYWGGLCIKLPGVSGTLASSSSFSIALKIDENADLDNCAVYIQLGVEADDSVDFEDTSLIPSWKILDESGSYGEDVKTILDKDKKGEWQTVTVHLTESDKSLFSQDFDARLIITSTSAGAKGTILAGPYEAGEMGFSVKSEKNSTVYTSQKRTDSAGSSNYAQVFEFTNTVSDTFTLVRYYGEMDFENYKNLILRTKLESTQEFSDESSLTLTLERPESGDEFKTAVKLTLGSEELQELSDRGSYYDLKINLFNKTANLGTVEKADSSVVPTRLKIEFTSENPATLYLDEFSFTQTSPYATVQNITKTSYQKKGDILKIGNSSILSNFNFESTAKETSLIKKKDNSNKENQFTGSAAADITLTNIAFSAQAGRSSSSNIPFSTASHSIKTASPFFRILSAEETFNFNNTDESLKKVNSVQLDFSKLNVPLTLNAKTGADCDIWALNQDSSSKIQFNSKYFVFSATAGAKQKLSQSSSALAQDFEYTNYASSWKKITQFAFDRGNSEASTRNIYADSNFQFDLPFLNLKPSYKISLSQKYKNSSYTTYTDSTVQSFSIPFTVKKHSFSLLWEKSTGGVTNALSGGSYETDAESFKDVLSEKSWYFKALPLYDIFSNSLNQNVLKNASMNEDSVESLYYTSLYSVSWRRPFSATYRDFFIPQNASVSFERDIKTSSSVTDIYQFKGLLGFNALNVFGSKSSIHLTDLFEQDEYLTSLSLTVKTPKENFFASTLLISFYQQSTFYITKDSFFKAGAELSFEDKDNLSSKATLIFKRPGKRSLLQEASYFFYKPKQRSPQNNIARTDSINIVLSKSSSSSTTSTKITHHQNYEYLHSLDIKLNSFVELNSSLGISYDCVWDRIVTLGASAGIGATIRF